MGIFPHLDPPQSSDKQQVLWVTRLDNDITEPQLANFFDKVAPVLSLRIRRHTVSKTAFAEVTFRNTKEAIEARDSLDSKCINGKPVRIMLAVNKNPKETNGCANVFVKNLNPKIDSEFLRKAFSVCGPILSCKVATDSRGRSKGYGYLQFEEEKAAQFAIREFYGCILRGYDIKVSPFFSKEARDVIKEEKLRRTVFIKNLPEDVEYEVFASVFRHLKGVKYVSSSASIFGQCSGTGYVTFAKEEDAAGALKNLNGHIFQGKSWEVELAWSEDSEPKMKQESGEATNLYVKNVDKCASDETLKELFSQFGRITSCKIILDTKGQSKGFGFVAFSTSEEASKAAKEMNGKMIGTNLNPLYVAFAQRMEERKLMLQARFGEASSQEIVARVPPRTSVSALGVAPKPLYVAVPLNKEERKSMLQACFAEASSKKLVAMAPPKRIALAPIYPAENFQFGGVAPVPVMQYQAGIPQLMPPLMYHNPNQSYMPYAHWHHVLPNHADGGMVPV